MTKELKKKKRLGKEKSVRTIAMPDKLDSKLIGYGIFALLSCLLFFPELAAATTLEQQLDTMYGFFSGKLMKFFMLAAAACGLVTGIVKASWVICGVVVIIVIVAAFLFSWIDGGMKLVTLVTDNLHLFA